MISGERIALLAGTIMVCVFALSAWADAASVFVSPSGNDSWAGTRDKPFATITRAQRAVRALVKAGLNDDVLVVIRGGTYRLTGPLVFGPGDGGGDKDTVTYAAQPDEKVVISGGVEITGWRDAGDGVWAATVPVALAADGFNELFVGGQRRAPARHPNEDYLRVDKAIDARRSFLFNDGDIPPVKDASQATLVYLHDWAITRVDVEAIDQVARKLTTKYDVGCKANYWRICGFEAHPRYFVTGAREFLDAPGEWWLDRTKGEVLYRAMPGEKLDGFRAVAPLARQLLVVSGGDAPDKLARNLRFVSLNFEHCAWSHVGARYAGGQACFHFIGKEAGGLPRRPIGSAVEVTNARGVRFEQCSFRHLGGGAVSLGRGCRDSAIVGCTIADVAGNGVMLGEAAPKPVPAGITGANTVRDCTIQHCGAVYYGAVGIWVGLSGDNVIAQNEVCHLPYTGISVGWRWNPTPTVCKGNLVTGNHIHHVMGILSDGGGIYTLGRQPGTKLTSNWIHDIPINVGRAESNGMFLDEGTTDLLIENNLIHDLVRSPLRFHKAGVNLVKANVLVCGKGVPPVRYNATPKANIKLQDNSTPNQPQAAGEIPGKQAKAIRQAAGPAR